jgi:hypothetical protein
MGRDRGREGDKQMKVTENYEKVHHQEKVARHQWLTPVTL